MTCPLRPLIYMIKCSMALAPYEFVDPAKQGVFVASCSHGGAIRQHLTPVQQSVDMYYATTLYRIWNYGKPTMLFLFLKLFFGFSIRPTHTLTHLCIQSPWFQLFQLLVHDSLALPAKDHSIP